ncbi:MAG: hypothetical protein OJF49_004710 [Ktedonobacterales bacterium]|nr:MAG: hypothetical protein OJF49_004710 [Ktedonobacterales bacterium]
MEQSRERIVANIDGNETFASIAGIGHAVTPTPATYATPPPTVGILLLHCAQVA